MDFAEITPVRLRRLAPGEVISEHGIVVTKLDGGDEKWRLIFMYHGHRVKRVIGLSSEGWNRTKVADRMASIKAELVEGTSTLPKGRKTHLRFNELASWYLAELEATNGKNVGRKRLQLERRLVPFLGGQVVEAMTDEHFGRYAKRSLDQGLSPSTINRDLATVSHMFTTAERRRKIRQRPCKLSKLPEPEGRTVVLTAVQIKALLAAAKADANPYLWLFIVFGLNTGMRSAEIVSARFDLMDWERNRLFLPKAKAGPRMQPLTNSLVEALARERAMRNDQEGWVFPSALSASGHATNFNEPFRRAVEAAGLIPSQVTPHVMRHTAATIMVASGAPLPAIQKVTGHKTLAMLLRYAHLADEEVDQTVSSLDGIAA